MSYELRTTLSLNTKKKIYLCTILMICRMKKIFVSGCYDMLHSGHVAFFEEAARLGDLYVGIGSDATVFELKGRKTINTDAERLYMVKAVRHVKDAWVNSGAGLLDFEPELRRLHPDIFFVNEDGHSPDKEKICRELGIEYKISRRIPHAQLPVRSTTALRQVCTIPYRIDLAGGWLDQPFVSAHAAGAVIVISIEPTYEFNERSGMATSSRNKAIEMWQTSIPSGDYEKLAKTLFCFENPPGTQIVSGSQDALGIVLPGLNKLDYDNSYWPSRITRVLDDETLRWLESHLRLVALSPRNSGYNVLIDTNIDRANVARLSAAVEQTWDAILAHDLAAFAHGVTASFEAQVAMFPHMADGDILCALERYKPLARGWKLSGAGGGGYFIFVTETDTEIEGMKIKIRKE
jgi:cytidyltransferase-like protein